MKPCENKHRCSVSTGLCGSVTFGWGYLDDYGYWEYPCIFHATEWKTKHPEDSCWPEPTPPTTPSSTIKLYP